MHELEMIARPLVAHGRTLAERPADEEDMWRRPDSHRPRRSGCATQARVIVEQPFGRDLAFAQALNTTIHQAFPEPAVYRIDHFLGKEAVQNLLYFRFADAFLEPIWSREYIDGVQITMPEAFDVRGS